MRQKSVLSALLVISAGLGRAQPIEQPAAKIDFVKDIQPIFQKSCVMCHGALTQMAGLRVDAKQSVMAKVVIPGKADESKLYQRVAGIGDVARMPMGGRLADAQIATIKAWIE